MNSILSLLLWYPVTDSIQTLNIPYLCSMSQIVIQELSPSGELCVYRCLVRQTSVPGGDGNSPTSVSSTHPPTAYVPGRDIHISGCKVTISVGRRVPRIVRRPE